MAILRTPSVFARRIAIIPDILCKDRLVDRVGSVGKLAKPSFNFQRSRVWFLGANLQWGINDYPKMQLKRDVIFGFTDVLGSI
jgi:hypothetical protein